MDTQEELLRDRWIQTHMMMCGTCIHRNDGVCKNEESYLFCELVGDDDMCDKWTEDDYARRISEQRKKTYEKIKRSIRNAKDISNNARDEK